MKYNVDIVKGFRSYGQEGVYNQDPLIEVKNGDIVSPTGQKITLTDTHLECGVAIQPSKLSSQFPEGSGKIPVYITNFVLRTARYDHTASYAVDSAVSVKDGLPTLVNGTNTIVWGYVTAVGTDGTIDIRVNY